MRLQEIFDQLSAGEFSQLSIGGQDAGTISPANYAKVIGHINLALTALYGRFNLKERSLVLQMQESQTLYQLNSKYAVTGKSQVPVRYILDSASNKFVDDIIKISRVTDEDGNDLPLNDDADPLSVKTPTMTSLQVPAALDTQDLTVVYKANHKKLAVSLGLFNPAQIDIELPDTHLTPLLYYVASRVNNPIGMTNEFHAGNSWFAKYEAACRELEGTGLQVDQGQSNDRFRRGGWV